MRGCSVDRLGERTKGDAALLQLLDDPDEVGERAAEPIELPNDEHVAYPQIFHAGLQSRTVVPSARGMILMQMALVDARANKRIALQIHRLPLVARRHPHVADQHVRQTPFLLDLSHSATIRQSLSHRK